jgi:CRP-like cAMP-binding protein
MEQFKKYLQQLVHITDADVAQSMSYFTEVHLKKDDVYIVQGKVCRQVAFILKGTLRTYYINDKGEETTSCFCNENNFTTAFKSFVMQQPSDVSIQAIEDAALLVIDYGGLQALYQNIPIWQSISRAALEREYIVVEQYAALLNNESAKEKYTRLMEEYPTILHKASVEDIASYLGVTRRTLSRIRKELSHNN